MKGDHAKRGWARWTPALGVLWAGLSGLGGCSLIIGIEPIEVTGGAGGAGSAGHGSDAHSDVSASTSSTSSSGGGGGGCSAAAMACAQCAQCGDIVDVTFDGYGTLPSFHDTTTGRMNQSSVGPVTGCTQAGGPERIYAVHLEQDGFLTASLARPTTTFDSVLYARRAPDCCTTGATYLCADSSTGTPGGVFGGEVLSFRVAKDDVWYIIVDGVDAAHGVGDYELTLSHASGVKCDSPIEVPIELGSKMTLLGDAQGLGDPGELCGQCGPNPCAGAGSEAIYRITAPPTVKLLQIGLDPAKTQFDSVLYTRHACEMPQTQIDCQDMPSVSGEKTKLDNNNGTPFYVFVDTGTKVAQSYGYTLLVTPSM